MMPSLIELPLGQLKMLAGKQFWVRKFGLEKKFGWAKKYGKKNFKLKRIFGSEFELKIFRPN
jgi:hypothetical protein